jgi:hypothetical protein
MLKFFRWDFFRMGHSLSRTTEEVSVTKQNFCHYLLLPKFCLQTMVKTLTFASWAVLGEGCSRRLWP